MKNESGRNTAGEHALETMTDTTGGAMFYPDTPQELGAIFDRIDRELRTQYLLAYYPTPRGPANTYRSIVVTVNPPTPSILFSSHATPAAAAPVSPAAHAGRPLVLVTGDSVSLTVAAGIGPVQDALGVVSATRGSLGCGLGEGSGKVRLGDGRIVTEAADCRTWPDRPLRGWPGQASAAAGAATSACSCVPRLGV